MIPNLFDNRVRSRIKLNNDDLIKFLFWLFCTGTISGYFGVAFLNISFILLFFFCFLFILAKKIDIELSNIEKFILGFFIFISFRDLVTTIKLGDLSAPLITQYRTLICAPVIAIALSMIYDQRTIRTPIIYGICLNILGIVSAIMIQNSEIRGDFFINFSEKFSIAPKFYQATISYFMIVFFSSYWFVYYRITIKCILALLFLLALLITYLVTGSNSLLFTSILFFLVFFSTIQIHRVTPQHCARVLVVSLVVASIVAICLSFVFINFLNPEHSSLVVRLRSWSVVQNLNIRELLIGIEMHQLEIFIESMWRSGILPDAIFRSMNLHSDLLSSLIILGFIGPIVYVVFAVILIYQFIDLYKRNCFLLFSLGVGVFCFLLGWGSLNSIMFAIREAHVFALFLIIFLAGVRISQRTDMFGV